MAIKPESKYPGKTNPGNTNYPFGYAKNVSSPGAGNGTPLEEAWVNDWWGLSQALLQNNAIIPNNNPDTAPNSQYKIAIEQMILAATYSTRVVCESDVTNPTYKTTAKAGSIWDSNLKYTIKNTVNFAKNIRAAWAAGNGNGGLPTSVVPSANQTIYFFMIWKDDGVYDFGWDTNLGAANLLTASGYTHHALVVPQHVVSIAPIVLIPIKQVNNHVYFKDGQIEILNASSPATSFTDVTTVCPSNLETIPHLGFVLECTTSPDAWLEILSIIENTPKRILYARSSHIAATQYDRFLVGTDRKIRYQTGGGIASQVYIYQYGFDFFNI